MKVIYVTIVFMLAVMLPQLSSGYEFDNCAYHFYENGKSFDLSPLKAE